MSRPKAIYIVSTGFGVRGAMGPGVCVFARIPGLSVPDLGLAVDVPAGAAAGLVVVAPVEGASFAVLVAGAAADAFAPGKSSGDKLGGGSTA